MSAGQEAWDQVYATKAMAAYPDNALIRFVAKHYYAAPNREDVSFLDLGSGAGGSTWYLAREGFDVVAVDWSKVAVQQLRERLLRENLPGPRVMVRDLTEPFGQLSDTYDAVIDVSSLCYLPSGNVPGMMKFCRGILRDDGRMFSITPSFNCARHPFETFAKGVAVEARFMDKAAVREQFADFSDVQITPYDYISGAGFAVHLWVVDALK